MNIRRRISLSLIMLVIAAACAVSALAVSSAAGGAEVHQGYLLREYEGYVAIFDAESGKTPKVVTAIEMKNLTEADRTLMEMGLPAETEDELALLLEDLGS